MKPPFIVVLNGKGMQIHPELIGLEGSGRWEHGSRTVLSVLWPGKKQRRTMHRTYINFVNQ